MLTGELPIGHFALPSEKSAVDPRADAVVLRALEKEREKRYRSAAEVKTSIEAITAGPAAPTASAAGEKPERPLWWTVSAWAFVAIGLLAVIDILGGFYSRPMSPTLSPAVAHLFAGIALLTANRRWRLVALAALGVALLLAAFIAIVIAISPERATLTLPVSNLTIRASEKPRWVATTVVLLAIVFGWPCYLLMCAKAKALFGITKSN